MTASTSESLCETIRPYIPRALPSTLAYTEHGSNIDTVAPTVTLGSNHPAATAEYCNPAVVLKERKRVPPKVFGLGLGLPSGLKKRTFMRQSSRLPSSQGCHDLASMARPDDAKNQLRRFRKQILSPILEEESPRFPSGPSPNHNASSFPKGGSVPSPTTQKHGGSGGLLKRTLHFLF